jgi:hypothetical protein
LRHVRYLRSRGLRIVEGRWHISFIALVFGAKAEASAEGQGRADLFNAQTIFSVHSTVEKLRLRRAPAKREKRPESAFL